MGEESTATRKLPFSQRYGLTPAPSVLSYRDISKELWVDLFNSLQKVCSGVIRMDDLAEEVWMHFHHEPLSEYPNTDWGESMSIGQLVDYTRQRFDREGLTRSARVYDLIEFVHNTIFFLNRDRQSLQTSVNDDFARNFASVKMIEGLITPITDEQQTQEIEVAMQGPISEVDAQLHAALALLANRDQPNYRDSIKNSISAVETMCRRITRNNTATLGSALRQLRSSGLEFHSALLEAFEKMYGYTSDDRSGIRHAMMNKDHVELEDARYMLVVCSAFINYLTVKSDRAGISLDPDGPREDSATRA